MDIRTSKRHYLFYSLLPIFIGITPLTALDPSKFGVPKRLEGSSDTIFTDLSELSNDYEPIDLGEGAPNFFPPLTLRQGVSDAVLFGNYSLHQYTKAVSHPRLVRAIATFYSPLLNRSLNSDNILITVGATEALYATFQSHTLPGDEWIVVEPFYNPYETMVKAAYGVPKFIELKPVGPLGAVHSSRWTFDRNELANLFNEKTKGILLNTPHNPTGKIFTHEELEFIANLAKKWNTLVVCDEAYQFLVYDQNEHIRIATLPEMFERTIMIGSGGKAFSATGYRIGWAYGGTKVIKNLKSVHELLVLSVPTPIQEAYAVTFEKEYKLFGKPNSYLSKFRQIMEKNRNYLVDSLNNANLMPIIPQGGYFVVSNWTIWGDKFKDHIDQEFDIDSSNKFSKWMIKNVGVGGIPLSAYYSEKSKNIAGAGTRYTFAKTDSTLKMAAKAWKKWSAVEDINKRNIV